MSDYFTALIVPVNTDEIIIDLKINMSIHMPTSNTKGLAIFFAEYLTLVLEERKKRGPPHLYVTQKLPDNKINKKL